VSDIPAHLQPEQRAVESQVRTAFHGVNRVEGVSWSESFVVDGFGSEADCRSARASDTEKSWEDLVDDPAWEDQPGTGGFNFLDAIGFRYYLAPAMIRCSRCGAGEFVGYALEVDSDFRRNQIALFTPEQKYATARFLRFMIAVHHAVGDDVYGPGWEYAYRSYWKAHYGEDLSSQSL
jgi:hypothetical protein